MSEPIPSKIIIGGPIPRSLLEELAEAISSEGVGIDWDEHNLIEAEALAHIENAAREHQTVTFTDSQANYGQFNELEGFLNTHNIHYDRHNDAKYEYNAEWVCGRDQEKAVCVESDQDGHFLVNTESLNAILGNKDLSPAQKLKAIRLLANPVAPLQPLTIVEG